VTVPRSAEEIGVFSLEPCRAGVETPWDQQWRSVMAAYDDLAEAYYGEGCARAGAKIAEIVMRFFRQCHEMKQCVASTSTGLHDFLSSTRALEICDALVAAERHGESGSMTAKIHRTYTEPNGRAYAIIQHSREGERPRTVDAIVIAETCVNEWTRFMRRQRRASVNAPQHH
jgi:hypothetical protein